MTPQYQVTSTYEYFIAFNYIDSSGEFYHANQSISINYKISSMKHISKIENTLMRENSSYISVVIKCFPYKTI